MEKIAFGHTLDESQRQEIDKISKLYKVLGEKNRFGIVYCLRGGQRCVHELCCLLDASQSLVSHQLKVLREAKIVSASRRGNEIVYSLADGHIERLLKIAGEHISEL